MKTLFAFSLCLFWGALESFGQTPDAEGFILVKDEPPHQVRERWVEYPGHQPVVSSRELKSEFTVNASVQTIIDIIKDDTRVKAWQSHVKDFKIHLKNDSTWDEYSCHDIPWPFSDQDSFMEYRLIETMPGQNYVIVFRSRVDNKLAPVYEDINRIELHGSWTLEQLTPGKARVIYKIQSVPTTNIPRMIIDPIVRNNLISTIKSLVEIAEK